MRKGLIFGAAFTLLSTPAFAETNAWGGVSAGINIDGGSVSAIGRLGVDTSIGKGAFMGFGLGFGDSGAKDCVKGYFVAGDRVCVKGGRELLAETRLGAVTSGGSKIYALAGYTNLSVKATVSYQGSSASSPSTKLDGISAGLGYEMPLGSKAFLRTEFRYANYESGVTGTSVMPTIGFKF
ncbi:MAG: hypothetical protein RL764_349 [Pseudomonadota bacterium]